MKSHYVFDERSFIVLSDGIDFGQKKKKKHTYITTILEYFSTIQADTFDLSDLAINVNSRLPTVVGVCEKKKSIFQRVVRFLV